MKPNELINTNITSMHSQDKKTIKKYLDKDCVMAYYDCEMGNIILIKGKRNYLLLVNHKNVFQRNGYTLRAITTNNTYTIEQRNNCLRILQEKGEILKENAFKNYKLRILAEQI